MSLCVESGCSFCCDGTLYATAAMESEYQTPLRDQFTIEKVIATDGEAAERYNFLLPCKLCVDEKCSVHDQERPAICGDYLCKLVGTHQKGDISSADAKVIVDSVKEVRARLMPALIQFMKLPHQNEPYSLLNLIHDATRKVEELGEFERKQVSSNMLLDMALIRILLAKNFDSRLTKHTQETVQAKLAMRSGNSES